jgi:hypothetical protein
MMYQASGQRKHPTVLLVVAAGLAILMAALTWAAVGCGRSGQPGTTTAGHDGTAPRADGSQPPAGATPSDVARAGGTDSAGDPGGHGVGGGSGTDGGPGPGASKDNDQTVGDGSSGGDGDPVAAAEDCVAYNPANLTVKSAGPTGWLLLDGAHSLALFDSEADAEDGVRVARNSTMSCFIGRDNDRPDRYRYLVRYWKGPSGLPLGPAPAFDCVSYTSGNLKIQQYGDAGWRLVDGGHVLLLLDTPEDAQRARLVAGEHTKLCFIGRGNDRPDPARYVVEYWRA